MFIGSCCCCFCSSNGIKPVLRASVAVEGITGIIIYSINSLFIEFVFFCSPNNFPTNFQLKIKSFAFVDSELFFQIPAFYSEIEKVNVRLNEEFLGLLDS